MKTDKVVKKLGAWAKNNTDCRSFSYGIWSFPTVIPSHGINPTDFFCRVCCIPKLTPWQIWIEKLVNKNAIKRFLLIILVLD